MAAARRRYPRRDRENPQYVEGFTFEQFQADQKTVDAVVRNLEIIGEAVRHLAANQKGLPGETPWVDIAGMRNILIHEYFGVDLKIIWHTIVEDLPKLTKLVAVGPRKTV